MRELRVDLSLDIRDSPSALLHVGLEWMKLAIFARLSKWVYVAIFDVTPLALYDFAIQCMMLVIDD